LILVLGAGPAGLTAARELQRHGRICTVLEQEAVVGGLSRTVEQGGFLFDIGGHRFYTRSRLVEQIWKDLLGDDLLTRNRISRIYYRGRFFQYPLDLWDVIAGLGLTEILRCAGSYVWSHARPFRPEDNFEAWVRNRFGQRLYEIFFRTYTEKVWGMPCANISAEWAAQRIRGLNFRSLVSETLRRNTNGNGAVTTGDAQIRSLIHTFYYPRRGPGMLWNRMAEQLIENGCRVVTQMSVERIRWKPGRILGVRAGGQEFKAESVISTLALRDFVQSLDPPGPEWLREAAADLRYRDFLIVTLKIQGANLFPDNWIYVHAPDVAVGRIQNFNNWSPEMSPDPQVTCLGMEYFCSEGDALWNGSDAELFLRAHRELEHLGLARGREIIDGSVLRVRKAYPVYDANYRKSQEAFRHFLDRTPNLQVAGRNGLHRYNNQDHAMLSGIMAARNLLGARYNVWCVNEDGHYLEESSDDLSSEWIQIADDQPQIPKCHAASTS
jgi:protoporphyrinogen oxidase